MFDMRKPCNDCPFRKGAGKTYQLRKQRLEEIFNATAFECHKTTGVGGSRKDPQQCAGLISVLYKSNKPNSIMQVASRLSDFDPSKVDGSETYDHIAQCVNEHTT